jgi:hypothetical protein
MKAEGRRALGWAAEKIREFGSEVVLHPNIGPHEAAVVKATVEDFARWLEERSTNQGSDNDEPWTR